jgi:hypothetical protein
MWRNLQATKFTLILMVLLAAVAIISTLLSR